MSLVDEWNSEISAVGQPGDGLAGPGPSSALLAGEGAPPLFSVENRAEFLARWAQPPCHQGGRRRRSAPPAAAARPLAPSRPPTAAGACQCLTVHPSAARRLRHPIPAATSSHALLHPSGVHKPPAERPRSQPLTRARPAARWPPTPRRGRGHAVAFAVCNESLFVATSRNFLLRHDVSGATPAVAGGHATRPGPGWRGATSQLERC